MVLRSRIKTLRARNRNRNTGHDYSTSPLISQQLGYEVSLIIYSLLCQISDTKTLSLRLLPTTYYLLHT